MQTDAEIFAEWLNPTATPKAKHTRRRSNRPVKYGLLVEQYDGSPSITDGKRRGFNGMRPRETASELTSDCVVTTAAGDRYTLKRTRTHRTELTPMEVNALVDLQNKVARRTITSADLPAIGNVE